VLYMRLCQYVSSNVCNPNPRETIVWCRWNHSRSLRCALFIGVWFEKMLVKRSEVPHVIVELIPNSLVRCAGGILSLSPAPSFVPMWINLNNITCNTHAFRLLSLACMHKPVSVPQWSIFECMLLCFHHTYDMLQQ
jgi:hypothetical protein